MEISIDTLIAIAGLFLGGGGGAFFTWRYQRSKAKAEAEQAEITATKELQDLYQQMLDDAKHDREDRKAQIEELRGERDHYKTDRNEIREQFAKFSDEAREWRNKADEEREEMKRTIARLGRKVDAMAPFMCGRTGCTNRLYVTVSDEGEVKMKAKSKSNKLDD